MTISSTTRKAGPFPGNGASTLFPFNFKVFDDTDIKVTVTDPNGGVTTMTLDSDFSVALNADQNGNPGGTITYPISGSPLPIGYELVGLGDLAYDQETHLTNTGGFYPTVLEDMSDRSTIQIQQLAEILSRAFVVSESESASPVIPPPQARANMVMGFDAGGNLELFPLTPAVGAGDLKNESWTDGTDYVSGTSSSVTLSRNYGTKANLGTVVMAGVAQDPNTYSLINGNTLKFDSVIPLGIPRIWCVGGTTLSTQIPPAASTGDTQLQWGDALERGFGSVAALRANTDMRYTRARTYSYSGAPFAVGDNGGGVFCLDTTDSTTTDDGATCIVDARGGRWKLQITGLLSVMQFGAKGDNVTDDGPAMRAAHATGRRIYYPQNKYLYSGQVGIPDGGIVGDGPQKTFFYPSDTGTLDTLLCNNAGATGYKFEGFSMWGATGKASGSAIAVAPSIGETEGLTFDNCWFFNFPIQIDFRAAAIYTIHNCQFFSPTQIGVQIANSNNPDSGDSCISDCLFLSLGTTGTMIKQLSSGGLKIVNTKINGGAIGYWLQLGPGAASTSDLLIANVSIENTSTYGIAFSRAAGATGTFGAVTISNVQMARPGQYGIISSSSAGAAWLSNVTIKGCNIQMGSTGVYGMSLDAMGTFNVGGDCTITSDTAGVGSINIGALSGNGKIGRCAYINVLAPVNGSGTTIFDLDEQYGAGNVTTSTGYGSMFVGSVAVTFPKAFLAAPTTVKCFPTSSGSGGVSGIADNVTANGFTARIVGLTNGGVVPFTYEAKGFC